MPLAPPHEPKTSVRPLEGHRAWVISDGKAGHEVQCLGVAEALGVKVDLKRVAPGGVSKLLAPWGPVPAREKFGQAGYLFAPPWPAIAFATGRLTTPYIRALKRKAGLATYTVILLDPKTPASSADLFWVPEHDTRRGANVVTTLTSPHAFSPARLAELRRTMPPGIAALPQPRVAVLIGGPNGDYRYTAADEARLIAALTRLSHSGAGLMLTPSRRTPPSLLAAIDAATAAAPRILWDGAGENPYPQFLAHAEAFVVTADSVNMAGEAAATGKPVYIFHPSGGSAKFSRFHASLAAAGITRVLPEGHLHETHDPLETWAYQPLDSARVIACEIERRWNQRASMLSGFYSAAGETAKE
ncbi:MAG: mitochondrial fission ELM1 family protein [Parvularculaceae bacterium]